MTSGRQTSGRVGSARDGRCSGDDQRQAIEETRAAFQDGLKAAGYGEITTEVKPAGEFYFAEDYHQQYLHKVPNGYCGIGGTGVSCPVGLGNG